MATPFLLGSEAASMSDRQKLLGPPRERHSVSHSVSSYVACLIFSDDDRDEVVGSGHRVDITFLFASLVASRFQVQGWDVCKAGSF